MSDSNEKEDFFDQLKHISEKGIQVNRKKLKKDMCSQFSDYHEYIRELVANAYDAHAKTVWISAREDKENKTISVTIRDDGHGMDRQGIIDYTTIFCSKKHTKNRQTIGQFGVGKISIGAIPDQNGFSLITSTGKEAWQLTTGSFIEDVPIEVSPVKSIPAAGTEIKITFKAKNTIAEELTKLKKVLLRYVKYLPINIFIQSSKAKYFEFEQLPMSDWSMTYSPYAKQYQFNIAAKSYDVVLDWGHSGCELYQSNVFITDSYNLLSRGLSSTFNLPHLNIRIQSKAFELPFGRHCLSNEYILDPLSNYLRSTILPAYINELCQHYYKHSIAELMISPYQFEEMSISLLLFLPEYFDFLKSMPLFTDVMRQHYSLNQLIKEVNHSKVLYLDDGQTAGIDYSVFNAPVLNKDQSSNAMKILEKHFHDRMINLTAKDVIFETPQNTRTGLNTLEKNFQKHLQFNADVINNYSLEQEQNKHHPNYASSAFNLAKTEPEYILSLCEEAQTIKYDLQNINWRVNYLVQRDAKTPCTTQLFLLKENEVVLNLNHPNVAQLLHCAEKTPALAGHWGLAMCLTDTTERLLPHISSQAREDLILLDAMAKCTEKVADKSTNKTADNTLDNIDTHSDDTLSVEELNFYQNLFT